MDYTELEKLAKKWQGKVCLFGAGAVGRTWGYDLISAAGFKIDYYCDNKINVKEKIKEEITNILPEQLYTLKKNVLVFITVGPKFQDEIDSQLKKNGIDNIIQADYGFMNDIIESAVKDNEAINRYWHIIDDAEFLKRQFKYYIGYELNWNNLQTFNEKVQWLKIHDRNPKYTALVDKYEVKKIVGEMIGKEHIIPTIGIWDSFNEIDFKMLPDQFVLKCTHDSGSAIICRNKSSFDIENAKVKLTRWMKQNLYWASREWPYKNIKPRIIAEKYMTDETGYGLKDFKIFCFDGEPVFLWVDKGKEENRHVRNLYLPEWELIDAEIRYPSDKNWKMQKPKQLKEMLDIAKILSKGIAHVRTDFYIADEQVYFGELTFTSGSGFAQMRPCKFETWIGGYIKIGGKNEEE